MLWPPSRKTSLHVRAAVRTRLPERDEPGSIRRGRRRRPGLRARPSGLCLGWRRLRGAALPLSPCADPHRPLRHLDGVRRGRPRCRRPVGRHAVAPLPAALRRSYDLFGGQAMGHQPVRRRTHWPAVTPPSPRRMKPYEASGTRRVPATVTAQSARLRADPPLCAARCAQPIRIGAKQ